MTIPSYGHGVTLGVGGVTGRVRLHPLRLEEEGDGAVVDDLDAHLGAEATGRHSRAGEAQSLDHAVDERLGVLGPGRIDPARSAATIPAA